MASPSIPSAGSPACSSLSDQLQLCSSESPGPAGDTRELPALGVLSSLPRFSATRFGEVDDQELAVRAEWGAPASIQVDLPAAALVMKETVDYSTLHRTLTKRRGRADEGMIDEFRSVLRVMRAAPPEQCKPLLDAVRSWGRQPPEILHANIEHAFAEYPMLSAQGQRMLLEVIVGWNLGNLPNANQHDDYYRIADAILRMPGRPRESLLGRLAAPVRHFDEPGRTNATEGIARAIMRQPRAKDRLEIGAA